jgi:DNA-binding SARP family transcriptional activator
MDRMEVRLLGPMQVRRADGSVVDPGEWRTTKTLDLLRLLALSNGDPVPVVSVIDRLWPGVDEARGRASLRTAASHLRKVVAADCVERRGGALVLQGVWVDTQAYEALLSDADASRRSGLHARTVEVVREAEALYVGDIEVPDSSGDWLHEAREHLREQRCRALLDASDAAATLCWMRDSLELAQRAAALDMCEEAARALMRALAGVGEIEKALGVFDRTRRALAAKYGVDPSPQTRALHLQLLTGTAARDREVGLVGHEATVDSLAATISAMLRVEPGVGVVWLRGEPGSGRDSVVAAACAQAGLSMHDMGRDAWLHDQPTVPVNAWEIPDTDVLVMPHAESVPPHAEKLLDTLARQHGGVLVVPLRVAPDTTGVDRRGLGSVPRKVVDVGALSNDDLADLAELVLQGVPSRRLLRSLHAESGGLSGAACRASRSWLEQGRVVWSVDGLELMSPQPDEGAAASGMLRRRVRMLSPFAEDLVNVLAVAGTEVDAGQVAEVVLALREGARTSDVQDALGQLVDAGLVALGSAGYRLRESHARPELLAWMRPQVRSELHRLVADRLPLALPDRLRHLVAAGRHEEARSLGLPALEEARAAGDWGDAKELEEVLAGLGGLLGKAGIDLPVQPTASRDPWSHQAGPVQRQRHSALRRAAVAGRRSRERLR